MRRGFKAEAERKAESIRLDMGIALTSKLDSTLLANHVGAVVRRADELTNQRKLAALNALQPGAFSACTFRVKGQSVIVYNPLASLGRTQSDIAHEVAHIVLQHELQTVQNISGVSFFTCDPDEEQEANWLAGCLLLPRKLLMDAAMHELSPIEIAQEYGASRAMADFRLRATGVLQQINAARQLRKRQT